MKRVDQPQPEPFLKLAPATLNRVLLAARGRDAQSLKLYGLSPPTPMRKRDQKPPIYFRFRPALSLSVPIALSQTW